MMIKSIKTGLEIENFYKSFQHVKAVIQDASAKVEEPDGNAPDHGSEKERRGSVTESHL